MTAAEYLTQCLVTGQQHGGIAQGAAQALFEGVFYDEEGNRCGNLMDYTLSCWNTL